MKTALIRFGQLASLLVVIAGFGCSKTPLPAISVFDAAPSTIQVGDSAMLVFAYTGGSTKTTLAIDNGIGDVTGKTQVQVSPTKTTTYTLTVTDGSNSVSGTATITVGKPSSCTVTGLPSSSPAGALNGARVTVLDAKGNVDTAYAGTMTVTSDDTQAVLPAPTAFATADRGIRIIPFTLKTTGSHTVTFTDATNHLSCMSPLTITPSSGVINLTLGADANAAASVNGSLTLVDTFGNILSTYTGTVHFTSTDPAAVLPADVVFTASQHGQANFAVTFNTLGPQTLTATDSSGSAAGTAIVAVHGFVYTNPAPTAGRLQLLLNPALSNASVVQLDLVSNTSLALIASGPPPAPVRGGAFSAGMNLPVDVTRAVADTTPIAVGDVTDGGVLALGLPPLAVGAALPTAGPTAGVFYTGISQKAAGDGGTINDQGLVTGQIFYSLRLRLANGAAVGKVFDGNNLGPKFRAAVRSLNGMDVIAQPDFAIGTLEVR